MIAPGYMDNQKLDKIIKAKATEIEEGQLGYWRFIFEARTVLVVTDESHNRMRIMTPVYESEKVDSDLAIAMLQANFDRALDARLAIQGEFVWSVFIHPLQELSSEQFLDGLSQVVTLATNFGTSFSSTNLVFGGQE